MSRKRSKAADEELRREHYRSIPKKHWREMSGRHDRVLNDQAKRYGVPVGRSPINLEEVARWLHDFLAEHGRRLARDPDSDELLEGPASPALERYRQERATMAELDRREREGALLPREEVHETLGRIAHLLRSAGDMLRRQFGQDAADLLDEVLDDCEREIAGVTKRRTKRRKRT